MAGIFSLGGPQYDVDDVKIAVNNLDGTFGTLVDLPSCDLFVTGFRMKSAEMRGDGRITAVASQIEAAEMQIRMGSFSFSAYEIMFGSDLTSTGTTPNQTETFQVGSGLVMPYFAIIARSFAGESVSGTVIFIPYLKIMQTVSVRLEYNVFAMPEVNALALGDPFLTAADGRPLLATIKGYETLPALEMPPA